MYFDHFSVSEIGGRSQNEDSVGSTEVHGISAWIAADGLGGHVHGELASAAAVESLAAQMNRCMQADDAFITETFERMNADVKELNGALTTAVCAFSDGKTLRYANDGDSRFYFFRKAKVLCHSNDHSLAYISYLRGDIRYEDIPSSPLQNRLLHALGGDQHSGVELYEELELQPGDAFLLCTDGFWELVRDGEMENALRISTTAEDWMSLMLDKLKERLTPHSDNYTAVCVKVSEE